MGKSQHQQELKANGVDIIALLKKPDGKEYYILVKQFREPINSWIIEFPSGYIDDKDQSIEKEGARELKKETGYTAITILHSTKKGFSLNPCVSTDSDAIIYVEVDGNDPRNQNPKKDLDDEEEQKVKVVLVERDKLYSYLEEIHKNDEMEINTELYFLALSQAAI